MLSVVRPSKTDAFDRFVPGDPMFQTARHRPPFACSAMVVDWSIQKSPLSFALGCSSVALLDYLCEVPMLSLRGPAARELVAAMAAGSFTSDKIRCLHISTHRDDWDELTHYAMIHAALPNLVEYVIIDSDEIAGYGFYKLVEAFHTSHYGYLCIGRQQLAAVTLAIDPAGLELPQELLHRCCFQLFCGSCEDPQCWIDNHDEFPKTGTTSG
eukprot:TRINITY_DN11416_c4_g5_i1.p1 TRINITY_DN11416_c4_g5~~TRINITY_DN11416_c4_g5_i1.p1  ORF type:complete len:212 (+),score=19.99 TRINITY_DN11416_c4_g5_i1:936-1571(+)